MSKITIKNVSSAKIYLSIPAIHFSREMMPNREIPLTEDEYHEFIFDPGCRSLVDGHYLKIKGVDEEEATSLVGTIFEKDDINKMLETLDITKFAKFIPNATIAEKETVVKLATEKGITHNGFVTLIKKYCDVDIINAINMQHQAEEK